MVASEKNDKPLPVVAQRRDAKRIFFVVAVVVLGAASLLGYIVVRAGSARAVGHEIYPAPQYEDELRCEIVTWQRTSQVAAEVNMRSRERQPRGDAFTEWETLHTQRIIVGPRLPRRYLVVWLRNADDELTGVEVFALTTDDHVIALGEVAIYPEDET